MSAIDVTPISLIAAITMAAATEYVMACAFRAAIETPCSLEGSGIGVLAMAARAAAMAFRSRRLFVAFPQPKTANRV